MDSIIPIGQKNTLVEYMILSGADNRPPILDKDLCLAVDVMAALVISVSSDTSKESVGLETDIRQKDEKQSHKRQNRARNGKA
ncbi:hypothetical protein Tco_0969010 [Tanacetum coccineum]